MNNDHENLQIKRFLLGNTSEKESEKFGMQILSEETFSEKVSFAEEDLIENFLDDALTAEEKELFHENFLITPARIALLKEISLIRNYARKHSTLNSQENYDAQKTDGFLQNFIKFLSSNLRPIAAVLVILLIGTIIWRIAFYDSNKLSETEKEYAFLNAKDLSNPAETANLSSKNLIVGIFRDTNGADKLVSAKLTENILFRLALPSETPKESRFGLELIKGGQTIFRQNDLRGYQNQNGQELKVILPKAVLSKGEYSIKLNNGLSYGFTVE